MKDSIQINTTTTQNTTHKRTHRGHTQTMHTALQINGPMGEDATTSTCSSLLCCDSLGFSILGEQVKTQAEASHSNKDCGLGGYLRFVRAACMVDSMNSGILV